MGYSEGMQRWHETFVIFPKKTISGRRVRGRCYQKYVEDQYKTLWYALYATEKDVFKERLKGNS